MILFENVTKQFTNGTLAVEEVTFHIEPGEMSFIVGPSGAGKTTILRLLLKELEPTSGEIIVEGENLNLLKKKHLPQLRRKIGAAFQDFKLLEDRTVKENVALVAEMINPVLEEVDKQVENILETVGLRGKEDLFPSQLSGGELQRIAIARALATNPKILFADEPTGNLDQATGWDIINVLLKINKSGTTVLVATHNQEVVQALRKRVIELSEGRIVQDTKEAKNSKEKSKSQEGETELDQKEDENSQEKPADTTEFDLEETKQEVKEEKQEKTAKIEAKSKSKKTKKNKSEPEGESREDKQQKQ